MSDSRPLNLRMVVNLCQPANLLPGQGQLLRRGFPGKGLHLRPLGELVPQGEPGDHLLQPLVDVSRVAQVQGEPVTGDGKGIQVNELLAKQKASSTPQLRSTSSSRPWK